MISMVLASGLTLTGLAVTVFALAVHHSPMRIGAAGMMMLGIGIVWLYSDLTHS